MSSCDSRGGFPFIDHPLSSWRDQLIWIGKGMRCLQVVWVLFAIFGSVCSPLFAFEKNLSVREKFQCGELGSYIVLEHQRTNILLHLRARNEREILLEEVSIPSIMTKTSGAEDEWDWVKWFLEGAPGYTSWMVYTIDLEKNMIIQCLSRKEGKEVLVELNQEVLVSFIPPLMGLHLHYLSIEERLQGGPILRVDQLGRRGLMPWGPVQYRHGRKVEYPVYDAYTARWPHDRTPLSGKLVILYFDQENIYFPFPYWIQIKDFKSRCTLLTVDSGNTLQPFSP